MCHTRIREDHTRMIPPSSENPEFLLLAEKREFLRVRRILSAKARFGGWRTQNHLVDQGFHEP